MPSKSTKKVLSNSHTAGVDNTSRSFPVLNTVVRFSVVMAVYKNDSPEWFEQATESILNQTTRSDDVVIVCDGAISDDLEKILQHYEVAYEEVTVVRLGKNVGAGQARNEGVKCAKNELVAIMDADDISLSNRFELQLTEFSRNSKLVLVGGQISEFENTPDNIIGYRKVPTEYSAIKKFARYRSPINHVTIMFKKSVFLAVGGYPKMTRAEDYYMVSSLLAKNYAICNMRHTIVNCRISSENIRRRKTWRNVCENILSRWKVHKLGAISFVNFCISSIAQLVLFVMPIGLLSVLFSVMLRSRHG